MLILINRFYIDTSNLGIIKLKHTGLILSLFVLSSLGILLESKIWQLLLKNYNRLSFELIFKAVCTSYTLKTVSTNFLGSVLGKNSIFGLERLRDNIYKNISFGLYQTFASTLISLGVIFVLGTISDLTFMPNWLSMGYPYILLALAFAFVFALLIGKKQLLFCVSLLRSFLFLLQYAVVIITFYEPSQWAIVLSIIATYFILKTFLPFLNFFGGIGLRELALATMMSYCGIAYEPIVLGGLLIWICNFVFPNVMGMVYLSKKIHWSPFTSS